ncbi:MAG: hypothetical protein SVZ03_00405 [Spirochaetota bacterium]|nr:hypothetical protein [Spirochaetota bacterium]
MKLFCLLCISIVILLAFIFICVSRLLAGSVYHTSYQSVEFIRSLNRNASTEVDATFFNPAGTARLEDGLYFYLSNHSLFQTKTIEDTTILPASMNSVQLKDEYVGDVNAYIFPNAYVVYKTEDWAFFGGLLPLAGGGSADFSEGFPSLQISALRLIGNPLDEGDPSSTVTGLDSFISEFKGSSVYFSGQLGLAYNLNDTISIALAGRTAYAYNKYDGKITAIYSTQADEQRSLTQNIDFKETGICYSIITGVNAAPTSELNIGVKFEYNTKLVLERDKSSGDTSSYPDGERTKKTLPMVATLGISYMIMPGLRIETDFSNYFNKQVDWDGAEDDYNHGWEAGIGLEYVINSKLKASAGYLYTIKGATEESLSEMSMYLDLHQIGLGAVYSVNQDVDVSIGYMYGIYMEEEVDSLSKNFGLEGTLKLDQTVWDIGIGLTYKAM